MPEMLQKYADVTPYITLDGSEIRELMHPDVQGNSHQSLAEATVHIGQKTKPHKHLTSEEIYHITSGTGLMTIETENFMVNQGDTVCIPPDRWHAIENTGTVPLVFLCCSSPAYRHDDTVLR